LYTTPIPPAPSCETMRYEPSVVPTTMVCDG
jgi:hypothetical protein